MTDMQRREAARQFYYKWKEPDKGQEKVDCHPFWIEIFQNILGTDNVTERLTFEKPIGSGAGSTNWIDVYVSETKTLIEQKSRGIELDKPQAGHGGKTPYEQAKDYDNSLSYEEKARWIVLSNFDEIWIYDMNLVNPNKPEPVSRLKLIDLQAKYGVLDFLVKKETGSITDEMAVSLAAGELVGQIYDALRKQYKNPDDPETLVSLNKLCVRIVFCLYAEDALVFSDHSRTIFRDYMAQFTPAKARVALRDLFRVLNQKPEERDPYLSDDDPILASFPYVNGGLFEDDDIEIPPFTEEIMDLLLRHASDEFDWSEISPTIFGAVFESTLNPQTRREGGMHYTSIENIHKVIDPLFLDELKKELDEIQAVAVEKIRDKRLKEYQDKLTQVVCLDPAAGSGNFLTESYLSIRKLENTVIGLLQHGQMGMADKTVTPIKVSIAQFYGIEINDFAVTVAKTALWIAEIQMMRETAAILSIDPTYLPLKTNANIVEGNALRIDWESVVSKDRLRYIMGNPPFVGARLMGTEQKNDVFTIFDGVKNNGNLDYVSCWYKKAADMMTGTGIRAALVSTNSITQGEQVAILWSLLFAEGVHIDFAYRTFRWDSEATIKAHVHCVIVGFSKANNPSVRLIWNADIESTATNINGYLVDADTVFVESRNKPLYDVPNIAMGNQPIDDGNYLFTEEEMKQFVTIEPASKKYFRQWLGSREFINGESRYCLWLGECSPKELRSMPECMKRVEAVKKFRLSSKRSSTLKLAETPTRFQTENMPKGNYIVIPEVSSEKRRYIPMGYLDGTTLCSNKLRLMVGATLYHFGIMESNVHMSWVRAVCGRLKSDYDYSIKIVYNNFPWPDPTPVQKAKIEQTAQAILDARALYPDSPPSQTSTTR